MTPLYIITPVSRPENLPAIALSLDRVRPYFYPVWLPIIDALGPDIGGGRKRNVGLDVLLTLHDKGSEGWVYYLDDDNVIHPDYAGILHEVITRDPSVRFVAMQQAFKDDQPRRACNFPVIARGVSDTALYSYHVSIAKETRWVENDYASDAHYARAVAALHLVHFESRIGSYYNFLR